MREATQNEKDFQTAFENLVDKYHCDLKVVILPSNRLSRVIQRVLGKWMKFSTRVLISEHVIPEPQPDNE